MHLLSLDAVEKTIPIEIHNFVSKIFCDQNNENCMIRTCSVFPRIECIKPPQNSNKIAWYQWENHENGEVDKVKCTGTVADFFKRLCFKILFFFQAYFCETPSSKGIQRGKRKCKQIMKTQVII